jgi:two-component system, NarL family, response regulator DevR
MGLTMALNRVEEFTIVGEAATKAEAVAKAIALQPDVIVMDVRLPDGTGIEACRDILAHCPQIKVIMLTSYAVEEAVISSILAGATGFIMKEMGSSALCQAIKTVAAGGKIMDVNTHILEKVKDLQGSPQKEPLSDREQEILKLIAQGMTNKEIAQNMYLSSNTVRNYVSNILHKLGFTNRSQITAYVMEHKYEAYWNQ